MVTADNAARWLLNSNDILYGGGAAENISNMKLQKLLYYAQGLHLALYDTPLFDDDIYAWEHGPVIPSIYKQYKANGANGISEFNSPDSGFTRDDEYALEATQDNFGQYSAWKLRNMTHEETPWKVTALNHVIPKEIIQTYFKENYIQ